MNRKELTKKIEQHCNALLYEKGFICSLDLFIALNYLSLDQLNDWRLGKIEYLEKVCNANLTKLSFVNGIMRVFAEKRNLRPSVTAYYKHGKGHKSKLIFSKSRDERIETHYATHFLNIERINELKREKNTASL